jgi:transposase, IS5 family
MPDANTMGRWGLAAGPDVLRQVHDRMVEIAKEAASFGSADACGHDCGGAKHSLSDRQHVAGRRSAGFASHDEKDLRDCRRGGNQAARPKPEREVRAVRDRAHSARQKSAKSRPLAAALSSAAEATSRVAGQAKRFSKEISEGVKRSKRGQRHALERLRNELDRMLPLVREVMRQTRARIFRGDTYVEGKIVSDPVRSRWPDRTPSRQAPPRTGALKRAWKLRTGPRPSPFPFSKERVSIRSSANVSKRSAISFRAFARSRRSSASRFP